MPIKNHLCDACGERLEKFYHRPVQVKCPKCGEVMRVVPSVPGYRRDRTVN